MKIDGKKYLDGNYTRIMIDLIKPEYDVKVKGTNYKYVTKNDCLFTDLLKDLSDDEKILEIVKHYLNYSTINYLCGKDYLPRYDGWFSIINSLEDRMLAIKLNDSKLSREIIKLVNNKYINDRYNYYLNHDINKVSMSRNHIGYGDTLVLSGYSSGDIIEIKESEKDFLKYVVQSKLDYESKATLCKTTKYSHEFGWLQEKQYFKIGDLKIEYDFSYPVHNALVIIFDNYNYELNEREKSQLKLKL